MGFFVRQRLNFYSEANFDDYKGCPPGDISVQANMEVQGPSDTEVKPYVARRSDAPLVLDAVRFIGTSRKKSILPYYVRRAQAKAMYLSQLGKQLHSFNMTAGKRRRIKSEAEINKLAKRRVKEIDDAKKLGRPVPPPQTQKKKDGSSTSSDDDTHVKSSAKTKAKSKPSKFHTPIKKTGQIASTPGSAKGPTGTRNSMSALGARLKMKVHIAGS